MSLTYPGGLVTKNPTAPTSTSAPGVWTMDQALQYIKAGTWPTPPIGDPYWQNVTLLSGTGSTNGAQNNTFLDSSTNNFTVTRNGNTTQGTFTPFSGPNGYWGNYFDGSTDYLSTSSTQILPTGDFTIEAFIYFTGSFSTYPSIFAQGTAGDAGRTNLYLDPSGKLGFAIGSSVATSTGTVAANSWNYVAVTRSGSTVTFYINGSSSGTATNSGTPQNTGIRIGLDWNAGEEFTGYISNLRVSNNVRTITSTPTSPYTSDANTRLLTCQSNRFVDNSTANSGSGFTITANGNVAVVPFAPFGNTSMYSATSVGGSGYFDGTGDYLSVANSSSFAFGTGDFTVEFWLYANSASSTHGLVAASSTGSGYWASLIASNELYWQNANGSSNLFNVTYTQYYNQWTHVAFVRNSGTMKLYLNGVEKASASGDTTNYSGTAGNIDIGRDNDNSALLTGYMSGLRIVKGTAVYTAAFTPPTTPPTAITNTQLLANYTNAGIYDQAAKNDMETVGNAQVSTSVIKYGNSMYFDGTGDYLPIPVGQTFNFGTGQFTIECWAYFNSVATGVTVVGAADTGGNIADGVSIYCSASGTLRVYGPSVTNSATATVATGQWYYIAVTRIGNTFSLFLNGNLQGTFTDTGSIVGTNSSKPFYIGSFGVYTSYVMNGYLSDFRVTRGLARYTYNFTPPTRSLPNFYAAPTTPTADPYFDYTTLLLPGSGTNGAQNNTFLDSSTNAFSITRNGNTTQGTFSPFSQTGWSNFFNGSSYLAATSVGTNFTFGTGDFTWECWAWFPDTSTDCALFGNGASGEMGIRRFSTGKIGISRNNVAIDASSAATVTANQWVHLAISRSSGTLRIFINGSQEYSAANSNSYNVTNEAFIGYNNGVYAINNTYISNMRVVKTGGIYTAAFTPSTTPLTTTVSSGTVTLLSCQSNRFLDNSTNAFALSVTGSPSVQAFSPFAPTAAYSAATNGGSGYFDGTGDYLSVANNANLYFGTSQFCVEAWVYRTAAGAAYDTIASMYSGGNNGWLFSLNSTGTYLEIWINPGVGPAATGNLTPITAGSWFHCVATRDSSNRVRLFVNGKLEANAVDSANCTDTAAMLIGNHEGFARNWDGYISNFRLIKGSIPTDYQTSSTTNGTQIFTPPTTPATTTSQGATSGDVKFLANFTNAGITDATAKNDLETVGNAQISNTTAKFGSTSMYFDGTGDSANTIASPNLSFGAGDFTVEFWMYTSSTSADVISQRPNGGYGPFGIYISASQTLRAYVSTSGSAWIFTGTLPFTNNTWTHVALVRYGPTVYLYVNGTQSTGGNVSTNSLVADTTNPLRIGGTVGNGDLNGYIQDLRITKGIARYTQNFTPPTAAFQLL